MNPEATTKQEMRAKAVSEKEYQKIARKIDELSRDPQKWEQYIAARLAKAVKHWPRR